MPAMATAIHSRDVGTGDLGNVCERSLQGLSGSIQVYFGAPCRCLGYGNVQWDECRRMWLFPRPRPRQPFAFNLQRACIAGDTRAYKYAASERSRRGSRDILSSFGGGRIPSRPKPAANVTEVGDFDGRRWLRPSWTNNGGRDGTGSGWNRGARRGNCTRRRKRQLEDSSLAYRVHAACTFISLRPLSLSASGGGGGGGV
ncbi:hypothetical protein BCR34DRAFT_172524 [Clohesyomyces aquaticus]|uniref:Uncharacterized protein n=1 Tax=Clohesyomyces aquaticus TaxID=1231657 RepID=A0A1Y1YGJ6_9PLEO|nr:hypothetical protein BCR34DRAFT_172524 [Clohesyomyces aquaticus]